MNRFYGGLALSALLLPACSTTARLATEDSRAARRGGDPSFVNVYVGKEIGRPYQVVGTIVAVADGESGERSLKALREEAAALGANAVVDLRLEIERGFWAAAVKATGLAVRADGEAGK